MVARSGCGVDGARACAGAAGWGDSGRVRSSLRRAAALSTALLWSACVGEVATFPCTEDDRCLPGFQCVAGECQACEAADCPLSQITLLSTGGGLACVADGICVRFPAGSLTGVTEVEVARTDNPVTFIGATSITPVFAVRPAGLSPLSPVEVVMTVPRRIVDQGATVIILRALSPRGPWESLETARDNTRASAYSPLLGLFVLARDGNAMPDAGARDAAP